MSSILYARLSGEEKGVLFRDGKPWDTFGLEDDSSGTESIWIAVVERFLKSADACFVCLPDGEKGFLPLSEVPGTKLPLSSGSRILVQRKKSANKGKMAYMTAKIALAGRYTVLLPEQTAMAVSARIPEESKQQMLAFAKRICPPGCGIVVREKACDAPEASVREEITGLTEKWQDILQRAKRSTLPACIEPGEHAFLRFLRDLRTGPDEIICDIPPEILISVPWRIAEDPLDTDLVRKLVSDENKHVFWLPHGGNVVMDFCEAMTVFDVNSAKDTQKRSTEEAAVAVNCEAAAEIARLIRLYRVSGIIIVDFIDMSAETSAGIVLDRMRETLADDPAKTVIHGYTSLGLMEITRKRTFARIKSFAGLLT